MYLMLTLGGLGFLLSFILTPIVRDLFGRLGFVDEPDSSRKFHSMPVPRVGGIAIVVSYIATFAIILAGPLSFSYAATIHDALPVIWGAMPAFLTLFFTGLIDDLYGLRPWQKLIGQVCASCLAVYSGIYIHSVADVALPMWLAAPVSVLWLLVCTNALNLIDGLDGLAAGVGMLSTTTMLIAALSFGDISLALVTAPLVGVLLGFLRYNFTPASVFLGDCGSLLIGFILGCCGVMWSQKATTVLAMTAPVMAISIPLLDVALSIVRRYLRRQPVFQGDRGHIHHRLLDRGFTTKTVALLMYAGSAVAAAFALLQSLAHRQLGGIIVLIFCAAIWMTLQQLRYVEFQVARQLLFRGQIRGLIDSKTRLIQLETRLGTTSTLEECWNMVAESCAAFGFASAHLHLDNTIYTGVHGAVREPSCWLIRVPLLEGHFIELKRNLNHQTDELIVPGFIKVIAPPLRTHLMADVGRPAAVVGLRKRVASAGIGASAAESSSL